MKFHQEHSGEPFQHTTDSNMTDDRTAIIKSVSSYRSEPIRWLEEGRIALGKLTLIGEIRDSESRSSRWTWRRASHAENSRPMYHLDHLDHLDHRRKGASVNR